MATGVLELRVTDALDEPVLGQLDIEFDPASGSPGGASSNVSFTLAGETDLTVSNLSARGGLGTRYEVRLDHAHFKTYAFFQVIVEKTTAQAADFPIRLVVNPSKVPGVNVTGAKAFQAYLLDPATQAAIRAFRVPGVEQPLFWPQGRTNASAVLPNSTEGNGSGTGGNGSGTGGGGGTGSGGGKNRGR